MNPDFGLIQMKAIKSIELVSTSLNASVLNLLKKSVAPQRSDQGSCISLGEISLGTFYVTLVVSSVLFVCTVNIEAIDYKIT